MNYTYNVLMYASHNVLFSKLSHDSRLLVKTYLQIYYLQEQLIMFLFKKEWGNILFFGQYPFYIYNPKPECLGKGYYS